MKKILGAVALFGALLLSLHAAAQIGTDPSVVTSGAEQTSGRGGVEGGRQRIALRIPNGNRLSRVFVAHGKWITGIRLEFSNGHGQAWGSGDDAHEETINFKDGEYVDGIRVHAEAHVDWIDFLTSKNRILHVGRAKSGTPKHGTDALNIPAHSRVTGLLLYVNERHFHEIQGVEAFFQPAL